MRNIKIFFLLNKNADLSTSQLWTSFVKINACRWYPALIIMRWVLQAVVSGISLAIAGRYIDKGFLVFLASTVIALTTLSPLFDDIDVHLRRYKSEYLHTLMREREKTGIFLIDNIFWFSAFRNLGTMIFWSQIAILSGGWRAALLLVVVALASYTVFIAHSFFRMRVNSISGMVSYALTGVAITAVSALIFSSIFTLILELKTAVAEGRGEVFGGEAMGLLYGSMLSAVNDIYSSAGFFFSGSIILVILVITVLLVRSSRMGIMTPSGFRSHYVDSALRSIRITSFEHVTAAQLRGLSPRYGHSELNVLVPMEFWLLVGFTLSVIPTLSNPAAILSLIAIQIYILTMAVHRGFAAHYPAVFEFGSAIKTLRVFRQTDSSMRMKYYGSSEKLLRHLSIFPVFLLSGGYILLAILLSGNSLDIRMSIATLIGGLIFTSILAFPMPRLCMASPIDAIEVLLRKADALSPRMSFEDLVSLSGYRTLRSIRMMPIFLVQTAIVFTLVLFPALGFLEGATWWIFLAGVLVALPVGVFIASHRSGGLN